ncbi:replication initiation protein [Rhizosphaericola mali]|uniref:Replication initiation protein n=1 Tax=Rhizosphaericola mali TaxID=2545455 RepID=A0A5P2G8P7_9BACT|nr:replication initiation protein [Rhizosphaericola mali]QES91058.1 replication initiation protein [Rhizosphaericola mali]
MRQKTLPIMTSIDQLAALIFDQKTASYSPFQRQLILELTDLISTQNGKNEPISKDIFLPKMQSAEVNKTQKNKETDKNNSRKNGEQNRPENNIKQEPSTTEVYPLIREKTTLQMQQGPTKEDPRFPENPNFTLEMTPLPDGAYQCILRVIPNNTSEIENKISSEDSTADVQNDQAEKKYIVEDDNDFYPLEQIIELEQITTLYQSPRKIKQLHLLEDIYQLEDLQIGFTLPSEMILAMEMQMHHYANNRLLLEPHLHFNSKYAQILYKSLITDVSARIYTVSDLKQQMGIMESYSLMADIKRHILDKAQEQINKHAPLGLNIYYLKTQNNKKITHILLLPYLHQMKRIDADNTPDLNNDILTHYNANRNEIEKNNPFFFADTRLSKILQNALHITTRWMIQNEALLLRVNQLDRNSWLPILIETYITSLQQKQELELEPDPKKLQEKLNTTGTATAYITDSLLQKLQTLVDEQKLDA